MYVLEYLSFCTTGNSSRLEHIRRRRLQISLGFSWTDEIPFDLYKIYQIYVRSHELCLNLFVLRMKVYGKRWMTGSSYHYLRTWPQTNTISGVGDALRKYTHNRIQCLYLRRSHTIEGCLYTYNTLVSIGNYYITHH